MDSFAQKSKKAEWPITSRVISQVVLPVFLFSPRSHRHSVGPHPFPDVNVLFLLCAVGFKISPRFPKKLGMVVYYFKVHTFLCFYNI